MNLLSSNPAGVPLAHDSRRFDSGLPRVPSTLIRLADADIRKCEASRDYAVIMHVWYVPITEMVDTCAVCAAGAVAAQTIGFGPTFELSEYSGIFCSLSESDRQCLSAIDYLRRGHIRAALSRLRIPLLLVTNMHVVEYSKDPEEFHRTFLALADRLEELGL